MRLWILLALVLVCGQTFGKDRKVVTYVGGDRYICSGRCDSFNQRERDFQARREDSRREGSWRSGYNDREDEREARQREREDSDDDGS